MADIVHTDNGDQMGAEQKSCWVCFASEDDEPLAKWLRPCRCSGSTAWVHEKCLSRWVDEKQRGDMFAKVTCSQCNTEYTIWYPPLNIILKLLERLNKFTSMACPVLTGGFILGGVYWTAVTYGAVTLMEVMGYDDGIKFLEKTEPFLLILGLPTIPILLVVLKMIRWEEAIVHMIYRPPTLNMFFARHIDDALFVNEVNPVLPRLPTSATRIFCGALILPTIATVTGRFLFSTPAFSHLSSFKKTLLGGAAFLALRGVFNIYFQYARITRRKDRKILNFSGERYRTANVNVQVDLEDMVDNLVESDNEDEDCALSEEGGDSDPDADADGDLFAGPHPYVDQPDALL